MRTFKTSGATKLLQLEVSTLRERDGYHRKKLHEAEEEARAIRAAGERRLSEAEAQRGREVELHEKRIVKLMNVLEALTVAGDAKSDVRVLAEKTNRVREVRELLDEEKLLVRAFQKRSREASAGENEAEREAYRRKVAELEAEAKMLKTFAETQVEEGRQAHVRESEIVNRRVAELEEQQKQTVRAWEGRLAEAHGRRTAEVADRDRALLESEEELRLELAEARGQAAQAEEQFELLAAKQGGRSAVRDLEMIRGLEAELQAVREKAAVSEGRAVAAERAANAAERAASALHQATAAEHATMKGQLAQLKDHGQSVRMELITRLTKGNSRQLMRHTLSQWITLVSLSRREAAEKLRLEQLKLKGSLDEQGRGRAEEGRKAEEGRIRQRRKTSELEISHGAARAELEARLDEQHAALEAAQQQLRTQAEDGAAAAAAALKRSAQIELEMVGEMASASSTAVRELQAEGEELRRRFISEAKERHALVAKQGQVQKRAAGKLAMRLGVKQLHVVFHAWCVVWRDSDATRKQEGLAAEVARCREEMLGLESSKDKMARRILQKILLGVVSRCFTGWAKMLREAKQEAKLGELRAEVEDVEKLRLTAEQQDELKKEKMARRLLGNKLLKTTATIFGAWRSDTLEMRQAKVVERLEELAMQQELAADEHKERMAKKIGIKIRMAAVQRCLTAWRDDVREEKRRRLGEQMEQAQAELMGGRIAEEERKAEDGRIRQRRKTSELEISHGAAQSAAAAAAAKADEVKERMSRFMIRMTGRQQLHQVCPAPPPKACPCPLAIALAPLTPHPSPRTPRPVPLTLTPRAPPSTLRTPDLHRLAQRGGLCAREGQ